MQKRSRNFVPKIKKKSPDLKMFSHTIVVLSYCVRNGLSARFSECLNLYKLKDHCVSACSKMDILFCYS